MLICGRNEGTGPGNHLFFKIICNIDTDRGPKRALPLGLDRQAIDGDQRGFGAAAGLGQGGAGILRPVTGQIDHLAHALVIIVLDQGDRTLDRGADRRATAGDKGRGRQAGGENTGIGLGADDRPGRDDTLEIAVRPFQIHHRDTAIAAALDCRDHFGIGQRRDMAFALAPRLDLIDRGGDIHREHEFKIDIFAAIGGVFHRP